MSQVRHLFGLVDAIWKLADTLAPMEYGIMEG
jgi:hypothetical protein